METAVQIDLTEDQVLLIAKALADSRRYDVLKRLADCALSCETMRACLDISRDVLEAYFARLRSDLL